MILAASLHYLLHWPMNGGYNFVSGPLADITIATSAGTFVWLHVKRHNCHVDGCRSVLTSTDPAVHAPACRTHHSHGHLHGTAPVAQ